MEDIETPAKQSIAATDVVTSVLAYGVTIGFFGVVFVMLTISVWGEDVVRPFQGLLDTLVGIIGTAWATIMAFYFGSSTGSREKSQTIHDIATKQKE